MTQIMTIQIKDACVVNMSRFLEFLDKVLINCLNKAYVFTNSSLNN